MDVRWDQVPCSFVPTLTQPLRYNENARLAQRRLPFNVDELARAAANSVNKPVSEVKSLRKMAEGGFNRVFEILMKDGTTILARLPYPSTLPCRLAVASEVATIDFVHAHGIPTPRILAYATITPIQSQGLSRLPVFRLTTIVWMSRNVVT